MKVYKLTLVFSVLVFMIVACLWVFGVLNSEAAQSVAGKLVGVILILGVGSGVMMAVLSSKGSTQGNDPKKPGPNF